MFRPHGYFRGIPCPNSSKCNLPNCFFSHELTAVAGPSSSGNRNSNSNSIATPKTITTTTNKIITENDKGVEEQPPKRRKLDVEQFQKVSLDDIDNESREFKKRQQGLVRNNESNSGSGDGEGGDGDGGDEWTVVGKGGKHSKTRKEMGGPVHKPITREKKPLRSILKRPGAAVTPSHSPSSSDVERGSASPASVNPSPSNTRNGALTGLNKEIEKPKPGEVASKSTLSRRRKLPLSSAGIANKYEALSSEVSTDSGGSTKPAAPPIKAESLNPRKVTPAPTTHIMRQTLLDMLYAQLTRLNTTLKDDVEDRRELIRAALDEEEQHARENPKTYNMVMKNRVMSLKKMSLEQYQALDESGNLTKQVAKKRGLTLGGKGGGSVGDGGGNVEEDVPREGENIDTGLSAEAEVVALRHYVHKKEELAAYGYILSSPSDEELEEAQKALVSAAGFEECDRCRSRFRVYPGRKEDDGSLASGGTCTYHWGRSFMQQKTPGINTETAKIWDCCKQVVGDSAGCTTAQHHIFVVKTRNRLATVWQFTSTPETKNDEEPGEDESKDQKQNPGDSSDKDDDKMDTDEEATGSEKSNKVDAICLDCEMCYTVHGLELVRVTATGFPKHEDVLDILVRPFGEILDLNTRFSGVSPAQFTSAKAYTPSTTSTSTTIGTTAIRLDNDNDENNTEPLQIVSSPSEARSLLLSLISPSTVIVGHALDNDLNALRLIHPTIVDTAILYPHRRGLPLRNSLKFLARSHLKRHIQQQLPGSEGHDSREDADVAGDLVRWKISQDVKTKKFDKDGKWKKKRG